MKNLKVFQRPSTKEIIAADLKGGDIIVQGSDETGFLLEKIRANPVVEPGTDSKCVYFRTGCGDETRGYFKILCEQKFLILSE